jgi:hypothetical protein
VSQPNRAAVVGFPFNSQSQFRERRPASEASLRARRLSTSTSYPRCASSGRRWSPWSWWLLGRTTTPRLTGRIPERPTEECACPLPRGECVARPFAAADGIDGRKTIRLRKGPLEWGPGTGPTTCKVDGSSRVSRPSSRGRHCLERRGRFMPGSVRRRRCRNRGSPGGAAPARRGIVPPPPADSSGAKGRRALLGIPIPPAGRPIALASSLGIARDRRIPWTCSGP